MIKGLEFDPEKTGQRMKELETYFHALVLDGERFKCQNYQECRDSHPGTFYQGQLVFPNIPNRRGFWEKIQ